METETRQRRAVFVSTDPAKTEQLKAEIEPLSKRWEELNRALSRKGYGKVSGQERKAAQKELADLAQRLSGLRMQLPPMLLIESEVVAEIKERVNACDTTEKVAASFADRAKGDLAWAITSMADDVFAARAIREILARYGETLNAATTLAEAIQGLAEIEKGMAHEMQYGSLFNSTSLIDNAENVYKFEGLRRFLYRDLAYIKGEAGMYADELAKQTPHEPAANGANGGPIVFEA